MVLNNRFQHVQVHWKPVGLQSKTTSQTGSSRRLKSETVKVSSSRSHSVTFLKVAVVPRVKRDLTVFDFRMYLNPDRTKTGDFVGLLLEVVFGSTHLFHHSLASINRLNKKIKNQSNFYSSIIFCILIPLCSFERDHQWVGIRTGAVMSAAFWGCDIVRNIAKIHDNILEIESLEPKIGL